MEKLCAASFLVVAILGGVVAQEPQIKWWFDMLDASYGSAATADIDADGKLEIVFSCYRRDSMVYALNGEDGSLLWKRNLAAPGNVGCNDVAPVIYDVDMDGMLEVVIPGSCNPQTFCLNGKTGEIKWVTDLHGSDSPPTIADIDGDQKPEIMHGGFAGFITALNGEDGSIVWDAQIDPGGSVQGAPIVFDFDNDGELEIIATTWHFSESSRIICYDAKTLTEEWTYSEPLDPMYHAPAFADIDEDGFMELAIGNNSGELLVINAEDGSLLWDYGFEDQDFPNAIYAVSIGDVNNDQKYEIVFFDLGKMAVLSHEGEVIWKFDIPNFGAPFRGAALADINNDAILDIIFGTGAFLYAMSGDDGEMLWTLNLGEHDGRANFNLDHGVLVADFDNDKLLDIFITGGYGVSDPTIEDNFGRAYCISTGSAGGPEWLMFRHDIARSGAVPLDSTVSSSKTISATEIGVRIFPQPASTALHLLNSQNVQFDRYVILDLMGRSVKDGVVTSGSIKIADLKGGIYALQLMAGKNVYTLPFLRVK